MVIPVQVPGDVDGEQYGSLVEIFTAMVEMDSALLKDCRRWVTRRGEGREVPLPKKLLERIVGEGVPVEELKLETVVFDVVGAWDFKLGLLKRYKEVRSDEEQSDEMKSHVYEDRHLTSVTNSVPRFSNVVNASSFSPRRFTATFWCLMIILLARMSSWEHGSIRKGRIASKGVSPKKESGSSRAWVLFGRSWTRSGLRSTRS